MTLHNCRSSQFSEFSKDDQLASLNLRQSPAIFKVKQKDYFNVAGPCDHVESCVWDVFVRYCKIVYCVISFWEWTFLWNIFNVLEEIMCNHSHDDALNRSSKELTHVHCAIINHIDALSVSYDS